MCLGFIHIDIIPGIYILLLLEVWYYFAVEIEETRNQNVTLGASQKMFPPPAEFSRIVIFVMNRSIGTLISFDIFHY